MPSEDIVIHFVKKKNSGIAGFIMTDPPYLDMKLCFEMYKSNLTLISVFSDLTQNGENNITPTSKQIV